MNFRLTILLFLSLISLAALTSAVTIIAPTQDIQAETLPATLTAAWNSNSTTFNVTLERNGQPYQENTTSDNSIVYELPEGDYTLTVDAVNATDTTTFTVQQESLELTMTVQESSYELGETVHLTASSSRTVTASLDILLGAQVQDTYTVPLESSVNLIYIPEEPGTYTARLAAQGEQATATFTVQEQEPLTIDFEHSAAEINRQTQFNATASGGTAPYTYQWVFSDDTTSSGKNVAHYFFEQGMHTATLIVTDAEGEQRSTTKTFDVDVPVYTLDVVVRLTSGTLVRGAIVRLQGDNYDETETTTTSGLATFDDLRGNYTITLNALNTTVTDTVEMSRDRSKVFTLNATIEEEEPEEETPETNTTTQPTTNQTEPDEEEQETQQETQQALQATQTTQEQQLQELRSQATDDITQRRFSVQLSAQKDTILKTLDLYKIYEQALKQIETASETQLEAILDSVPKEIVVRNEQTTISYPKPEDIERYTQEFLDVKGVQDKKLAESYKHSISQIADDVIIKTTRQDITIRYEETQEYYVLITKEVTAPEDSQIIEFIAEDIATDVNQVTFSGEYEVLRTNPVIRFDEHTYSYHVKKQTGSTGYTLVVPETLSQPPGLVGLFSVQLGETDPMRSILYIFLLGIFAVGIMAGGKIHKKRSAQHIFEEFTALTHDAIDAINNGNAHHAAAVTDDITTIYEALPQEQQLQVQDIMEHLKENQAQQHFFGALQYTYTHLNEHSDINEISSAYENTLSAYEQLSEESKHNLQEHIQQLHTYLDNYTQ